MTGLSIVSPSSDIMDLITLNTDDVLGCLLEDCSLGDRRRLRVNMTFDDSEDPEMRKGEIGPFCGLTRQEGGVENRESSPAIEPERATIGRKEGDIRGVEMVELGAVDA